MNPRPDSEEFWDRLHRTIQTLPTWDTCQTAVKAHEATALQQLLYEHEPEDQDEAQGFRAHLAATLIEWETDHPKR